MSLTLGVPDDEPDDDVIVAVTARFTEREFNQLRALSPGSPASLILRSLGVEQIEQAEKLNGLSEEEWRTG